MNIWTEKIATLLGVTKEEALKVQNYIDDNWLLDWSKCSLHKFQRVTKDVAKYLKEQN